MRLSLHIFVLVVLALMVSCSGWLSRSGPDVEPPIPTGPSATLPTSLHGTAGGMQWWYDQPDGAGNFLGVTYETAGCGHCHIETCDQCHVNADGTGAVNAPEVCMACHGRIEKETALGVTDVHFDAGMACSDCHSTHEMHGDGTVYDSMLQDGAMDTACEDCHSGAGPGPDVPTSASHTVHGDDISCDACHMSSAVTCYNCHFETLLDSHEKKAAGAFANFILLLNDADGKVRAGTYQSVYYEDKGFVAFGPFHGHSVQAEGRACDECHNNALIQELNDTGEIELAWWDDTESKIMHKTGVIPFVPDSFKFQFVDFDGAAWNKVDPSEVQFQWKWCSPLDTAQLEALGFGEGATGPAATLPTSQHGTADGMQWWYDQPDGIGNFIDVTYEEAGCGHCHIETCDQCHENADGTGAVNDPDVCIGCHGRMVKEEALGVTDVHLTAGMVCTDCHSTHEMHGSETTYDSMLSPGAMDTSCENCHGTGEGPDVPTTESHTVHTNMSCDACHMAAAVTCYNCHFQTLLDEHEKKAAGAFKDFILLLNDADGMIRAGTYQSVYFEDKGFVAFGPFHGHSVSAEGRACEDCHANDRIKELNDTGEIVMTTWDAAESKVSHTTGVIPFVPDSFKFQFVDFDGAAWGTVDPSEVRFQWKFCTPLDADQLEAMSTLPPQVTLPVSLHGTADGMRYWYDQPDGFGALSGVSYDTAGCGYCHIETCDQCHANADGTGAVNEPDACLGCHGRIEKEAALGLSDVHVTDHGMVCSDCHTFNEVHGTGVLPDSQFSEGALETSCEDCHTELSTTVTEHNIHGAAFHCDACHVESVINCNNCHFQTLLDEHAKKAAAAFGNYVILVNGPDGRLRTGTYQSVVYEGNTFVAFGPFHGHTITPLGRVCADCHDNDRITELNDTGAIAMTWWNAGESKLEHATGAIPLMPDSFTWQFVDWDGGTETWSPMTTDLTQYQVEFCTPLDAGQLAALGVE